MIEIGKRNADGSVTLDREAAAWLQKMLRQVVNIELSQNVSSEYVRLAPDQMKRDASSYLAHSLHSREDVFTHRWGRPNEHRGTTPLETRIIAVVGKVDPVPTTARINLLSLAVHEVSEEIQAFEPAIILPVWVNSGRFE